MIDVQRFRACAAAARRHLEDEKCPCECFSEGWLDGSRYAPAAAPTERELAALDPETQRVVASLAGKLREAFEFAEGHIQLTRREGHALLALARRLTGVARAAGADDLLPDERRCGRADCVATHANGSPEHMLLRTPHPPGGRTGADEGA